MGGGIFALSSLVWWVWTRIGKLEDSEDESREAEVSMPVDVE